MNHIKKIWRINLNQNESSTVFNFLFFYVISDL